MCHNHVNPQIRGKRCRRTRIVHLDDLGSVIDDIAGALYAGNDHLMAALAQCANLQFDNHRNAMAARVGG